MTYRLSNINKSSCGFEYEKDYSLADIKSMLPSNCEIDSDISDTFEGMFTVICTMTWHGNRAQFPYLIFESSSMQKSGGFYENH